MRSTGRTEKMLMLALMSDARHNYIFVPTSSMIRYVRNRFLEMAPNPSKVKGNVLLITNRVYTFLNISPGVHQHIVGGIDFDVFIDHTVFDFPYFTPVVKKELMIITAHVVQRDQLKKEREENEDV